MGKGSNRIVMKSYERLFFILWSSFLFVYSLFGSELSRMYEVGGIQNAYYTIIIVLLSGLFLMKQKYPRKLFIKYILFMLAIFLIEINITDRSFLVYILFILNATNIDFERLLRFDIKVRIFSFCFIVALCLVGVLDNYTWVYYGSTLKSAYGFTHPNTFTCYALIILLEWLLLRYKKMKAAEWILNALAVYAIYRIGGGRTSVYTYMGIYLLFILARFYPAIYRKKISYFMFTIITPLMAAFSIIGTYLYSQGNAMMIAINSVFTSRFSSAAKFMREYDIKLFGQEIETLSSRMARQLGMSARILDNAYIRCLLMYGVIFFALFIVVYILMLRKYVKAGRPELAICALFFVLIGLGESYMLNPAYNITLLCFLSIQVSESGYETRPSRCITNPVIKHQLNGGDS